MKAADLFVKILEKKGVEYVFGIPGEENLDLLEALRSSRIKVIVTRHEQAAGFMAATIGRLTGKAGVCISTLGPGATNFTTSAAYAQLGGMPMLMITGQKPIRKSKQGQFQIVDVVSMMKPLTKFTKQIVDPVEIPESLFHAFYLAEAERPGATHIELPEDIARENFKGEFLEIVDIKKNQQESLIIDEISKVISKAKNPLILLGAGANRHNLSKILKRFIEETGMYFFNTQMGKGAVDERHPQFLGTTALSANDYVHAAVKEADLIIAIGHDSIEKPPFVMNEKWPKVVHINYVSAKKDQVYFPQYELIGDVEYTIDNLVVAKREFGVYKKIKKEIDKKISHGETDKSFPLSPVRVVADVRKALPDDGIVALDNGMYKIWFARNYRTYEPNTLLLDNALASMGAGLPSAISAKLIYPQKKVIAVCGDGGFMMNSQELETAVRLKLNLVVLILNDNGYGMIKWKQKAMGFKDFALDFQNPDFVKYAQSYGAKGYCVKSANDLSKKLKTCLNAKGVHVIEVPINYLNNPV